MAPHLGKLKEHDGAAREGDDDLARIARRACYGRVARRPPLVDAVLRANVPDAARVHLPPAAAQQCSWGSLHACARACVPTRMCGCVCARMRA